MTRLSSLIGWASKTLRNDPQNRIRVRIRVRVRVRARVRVRVRFRVKSPFRYKLQATISTSGLETRRYLLLAFILKIENLQYLRISSTDRDEIFAETSRFWLQTERIVEICILHKFKMADGRHIEIENSQYLRNRSTDRDDILEKPANVRFERCGMY